MIDMTDEFAEWLADPAANPAFCLEVARRDAAGNILGYARGNSRDTDLTIDGDLYPASFGATISNLEGEAGMSVGNAEITALFYEVTAAHLKAGLYQGATYTFFMVNADDLTMGRATLMEGDWGQITVERLTYGAELRGLAQKLQSTFGRVCIPTCPYNTFDDDCGLDVDDFTETGTAEGVTEDGLTWFDSARTEPGPAGGVAISSITNANPPVVTLASPLNIAEGSAVILSEMVGMLELSGTVTARNVSSDGITFSIDGVDATDFPAFVSGTCTLMGGESGFFDGGLMTISESNSPSGSNNDGIKREVKSYITGQWTLQQAFPFPVTGNEEYTLTWGDDHTLATCRDKFNNLRRFGGDAYVPGQDSIMQVGRRDA